MVWRQGVAEAAGYQLEELWVESQKYPAKVFDGEWDEVPEDPIEILLNHSDYGGIIKHEHCEILADRLEELLPKLEDESYWSDRNRAQQFIKGLRLAHSKQENVEFY